MTLLRCLGCAVFLAAAAALGCSGPGGVPIDDGPDPYGGQTGSLLPREQLAPLAGADGLVPAGTAATVVFTDHPEQVDVTLTGPDGASQSLELVPLENGAFLARANTPLAPGSYTVEVDGLMNDETTATSATLVVVDSPTLHPVLGSLVQVAAPDTEDPCEFVWFELTLAEEVVPFAALLGLSVSVDDRKPGKWVDAGSLELTGSTTLLRLDPCGFNGCLYPGTHALNVSGHLAGSSAETSLSAVIDVKPCGAVQCSTRPSTRNTSRFPTVWLGFAFFTLFSRLRRNTSHTA